MVMDQGSFLVGLEPATFYLLALSFSCYTTLPKGGGHVVRLLKATTEQHLVGSQGLALHLVPVSATISILFQAMYNSTAQFALGSPRRSSA